MNDFPSNPFIGNPFMGDGSESASDPPPASPAQKLSPKSSSSSKASAKPFAPQTVSHKSARPAPLDLADGGTHKASTAPKAKRTRKKSGKNQANQSVQPAPGYTGPGHKVQVIAKIPVSTNTNLPGRDYLWFAVYPIIPRVGDCIFHDGRYFRVDAVFLYENMTPGWCADLEVSYYTRRR